MAIGQDAAAVCGKETRAEEVRADFRAAPGEGIDRIAFAVL